MLRIALTFCMLSQPTTCKDVQTVIEGVDNVPPFVCAKIGEYEAQKFMETNPGWRITKWGCRRFAAETDA